MLEYWSICGSTDRGNSFTLILCQNRFKLFLMTMIPLYDHLCFDYACSCLAGYIRINWKRYQTLNCSIITKTLLTLMSLKLHVYFCKLNHWNEMHITNTALTLFT